MNNEIIEEILEIEKKFIKKKTFLESLEEKIKKCEDQIFEIDQKIDLIKKSILIVKKTILITKKLFFPFFEKLVSKGLKIIFGEEYDFLIKFKENKDKISIDFSILKKIDDKILELDINNVSGGLLDYISLMFKIISSLVFLGKVPLFIDESFKFVSKDKSYILLMFLANLAKKLNLQIILISHDPNIKKIIEQNPKILDRVFKVENINNVSKVQIIK